MAGWGCECRLFEGCLFREPKNDGKQAIFVGEVKSLFFEEYPTEWLHQTRVRFRVVEAFTGTGVGDFELLTGHGGGDCGFQFVAGRKYLVVANRTEDGKWITGLCTGTNEAVASGDNIAQLRNWKAGRSRPRVIVGTAMRTTAKEAHPTIANNELEGFPIAAIAGGETFPAVTSRWGDFEIEGLPSAEFQLKVTKPGWTLRKTIVTGDLRTKSCAQVFLWASPD